MSRTALLLAAGLMFSLAAYAQDQTAVTTVFELTDGTLVESSHYACAEINGRKRYSLTTSNGEKISISDADIKSITEKRTAAARAAQQTVPKVVPPAPQGSVEITVFELVGSRKLQALQVIENDSKGLLSYSVITTDGRELSFGAGDIVSRTTREIALASLPPDIATELAAGRFARKHMIDRAAWRANNADNAVKLASDNLTKYENDNADNINRLQAQLANLEQRIAFQDAKYDAWKSESDNMNLQGSGRVGDAFSLNNIWFGSLRNRMEQAAVEKKRLEQIKKELDGHLKEYKEWVARLTDSLKSAQSEADAAKKALADTIKSRAEIYVADSENAKRAAKAPPKEHKQPHTIYEDDED